MPHILTTRAAGNAQRRSRHPDTLKIVLRKRNEWSCVESMRADSRKPFGARANWLSIGLVAYDGLTSWVTANGRAIAHFC